MFRVGQKVALVDDSGWREWESDDPAFVLPTRDQIYTVRWIGLHDDPAYRFAPAIRLAEIQNLPRYYQCVDGTIQFFEQSFNSCRFRPVLSRPTSIKIFTRMLGPQRERVHDLCGND